MTILPGTRSVIGVNVLPEIKHSYLISDAHIFNFSSFCVTSGVYSIFFCLSSYLHYISNKSYEEQGGRFKNHIIAVSILEIKNPTVNKRKK
jgi:hypothetical protein